MDDAIAVIGSANIDIGGYPSGALVDGDSNPGRVRLSLGGVGCNIARNLALLGANVRFLTALGGDSFAADVERALSGLGIDLSLALRVPSENTSTYLFIVDGRGDMRAAVNDMGIYRHQTRAYFESVLPALNACRAVFLDANLSEDAIGFLAESVRAPIFADAVSAAKAIKLRRALGLLHTLKPNRMEAELLSGVRITDIRSAGEAARKLLDAGLKRVFITLGADGAYCADECEAFYAPALPARVRNATGAGDAFAAAVAWAWLNDFPLRRACLVGNAAAAIAAESEETVSTLLSAEAVERRIMEERK
ncbi:MAG: MarR family transcriptional regulator [Clostridiales bacterium]|nr:MarR family transcriptional regulator [Clostridiales bacterium]